MKPGEIYHLEGVPSLAPGGVPNGRHVVVVTRAEDIGLNERDYVVACSASLTVEQQAIGVALPWSRQHCSTGFRRPCWAAPAWLLRARPADLGRCVGRIPLDRLEAIVRLLPDDPHEAKDAPADSR